MEDKRYSGYPVYAEDELGMIASVASANECTGLVPRPPASPFEAEAYEALYNMPRMTDKVNNEFQEVQRRIGPSEKKENHDAERVMVFSTYEFGGDYFRTKRTKPPPSPVVSYHFFRSTCRSFPSSATSAKAALPSSSY